MLRGLWLLDFGRGMPCESAFVFRGVVVTHLAQSFPVLRLSTTAVQALPKLENLDGLSRGELAERAFQALAAVAREKSRNAELVHKLQQLHIEGLQFKERQKRHSELQVSLSVRRAVTSIHESSALRSKGLQKWHSKLQVGFRHGR